MDKETFSLYMCKIQKLSQSSVNHYQESIKKIDQFIKEAPSIPFNSVFEAKTFKELNLIKNYITNNQDFILLNKKGHQMYSAGFNRYLDFCKGKDFDRQFNPLNNIDLPIKIKPVVFVKENSKWKRDRIIADQVIKSVNFCCENDSLHQTFTSKRTNKPFMEAHHLIPLSLQFNFENSLDIYANIVSLCPNCHRQVHFGTIVSQEKIQDKLFESRQDRLKDSGIKIGIGEFKELLERPRKDY